jgi:hypothetical protein
MRLSILCDWPLLLPQSLKETVAHLGGLAAARAERIKEAIERQQQLDALRLNFAKKGAVSHVHSTPHDLQ